MIVLKEKGDFSTTIKYLKKLDNAEKSNIFDKYGQLGVDALQSATPRDTSATANSWKYDVYYNKNESVRIVFSNTNIVDGVPIAILLQYGHGTRNGGYVEGRDYINPAIQPIFDELAREVWREVRKV